VHSRLSLPLLAGLLIATGTLAAVPASNATAAGIAGSAVSATPQPGDPLPACRYADVKTRYRKTAQWQHSLVDTERKESRGYVPPNLVSVARANVAGSGRVRSLVINDLKAMASDAAKAGAGIAVRSAYRSYANQAATFQSWVNRDGYQAALLASARPGHSEHQLGTTIDFRSANSTRAPWDYPDWATTAAGAWMMQNAWKYGFVMSYPKGKFSSVCYEYEPWHYRYYGRGLAEEIHNSHQVPRRYLWNHFETAP
jgi:D-alanyl-D-alanine carboxypeptidase